MTFETPVTADCDHVPHHGVVSKSGDVPPEFESWMRPNNATQPTQRLGGAATPYTVDLWTWMQTGGLEARFRATTGRSLHAQAIFAGVPQFVQLDVEQLSAELCRAYLSYLGIGPLIRSTETLSASTPTRSASKETGEPLGALVISAGLHLQTCRDLAKPPWSRGSPRVPLRHGR